MWLDGSYIVSHLTHQARSQLQEDILKIQDSPAVYSRVQVMLGVRQEGRKNFIDECFQIGVAEEPQPGLSLDSPQLSIGIDNAISWFNDESASGS